jgi:hypothetical protein
VNVKMLLHAGAACYHFDAVRVSRHVNKVLLVPQKCVLSTLLDLCELTRIVCGT